MTFRVKFAILSIITMAKREDRIITDPQMMEASDRFVLEVANKTYALAYLAIKDCISQKEYCKRVGINESRFSRVLAKLEKEIATTPTVATA